MINLNDIESMMDHSREDSFYVLTPFSSFHFFIGYSQSVGIVDFFLMTKKKVDVNEEDDDECVR
jgi:hypothetical protein